ncbi:MAG: TonB-dependent receptor [Bacteroidales bacterium]|nr:MAG: TonB-dependent receptor [Bacteroidales bacterium]
MKLKLFYLIFPVLLLALSTKVSAQTEISGTVWDAKNNETMVGVSIYITELQNGAITDIDGKYSLTIPYGKYTMEFSFIGYETIEKQINCNKERLVINTSLQNLALKLDEVVVTAKSEARQIREQAMPITVITMDQLQGTVSDVSDILSKTAGVKIRVSGGVGSASRISVRGLEGKRIGFFIDGTPLNDNSDFVDVNDIPIDFIERIEIYKGVVPAKFGGSAIGGAVNIIIREYPPKYMDFSYTLKSFNTHKINGGFKRTKNGIEIGVGGFYTYSDNNYKMQTPKEFGDKKVIRDHDMFEKGVLSVVFTSKKWWFDEVNFELVGLLSEKEIQGVEYNIQHAKSSSDAAVAISHLEKEDFLIEGLDFILENSFMYSIYQFTDTSRYTYNWDGSIKNTNIITELGIGKGEIGEQPNKSDIRRRNYFQKLNLNYVLNENNAINFNSMYRYVYGMPDDSVKNAVIGYETDFNSSMNSWVGGLSHEFNTKNKKFSNMLSLKYYYYSMQTKTVDVMDETHIPTAVDNTKSDFGISEALRYRITPNFLVKSSLAYDVRLPTDEELLGDGFMIIPAGNLNPERNTSFNLGFMYNVNNGRNNFQCEVNGFYMYLQDMIRFTGGLLQSVYQNFGEMRTLGAEFEIKSDVTKWLYLWGNVTYQDLRDVREYAGGSTAPNPTYMDRMPNIPYLFANAGLELHKANVFGGKGQNTRLFSDFSFVEEYFYDFEMSSKQEKRIPQSLTIDLGVEHSFRNQSIFISVLANNITDTRVVSEFNRPLPGRNYGIRLRYIFK